jgi:signal transduction protein with GAF and PtsI domain
MSFLSITEDHAHALLKVLETHLQNQVNAFGSVDVATKEVHDFIAQGIADAKGVAAEIEAAPTQIVETVKTDAESLIEKITHAVEDAVHNIEHAG